MSTAGLAWLVLPLGAALAASLGALWLLVRGHRLRIRRLRDGSWRRLQQVVDTISDPVLIVDGDGVVRKANAGLTRHLGIPPIDLLGRSIEELPVRGLAGEPVDWRRVGRFRARGGEGDAALHLEASIEPLGSEGDHRLVHLRNVSEEVASKREVEFRRHELEVLAELGRRLNRDSTEEALVALAVEQVGRLVPIARSGGVFLVDAQAGVLRLAASFGLEPEFEAAEAMVPLGECLCGRAAVTGEQIYSPCSATDCWHTRHVHAEPHGHVVLPLRAEDRVVGVLFVYLAVGARLERDHHELLDAVASELGLALMRAQATAELERNRARLERAFEEAPDAILEADSEGRVLWLNRRARRWFEEGGRLADDLPWARVAAAARSPEGAIRVELKRSSESAMFEVAASETERDRIQLILRDVTREVKLEARAMELHKLEAIGLFAAGLAHSLRNMVSTQLAHLRFLHEHAERQTAEGLVEHVEAAEWSSQQVANLVGSLLELAQPRALRLVDLDLSALVTKQLGVLRPVIEADATFCSEVETGLRGRLDGSVVTDAIQNLVVNALQAMPEGGRLEVKLRRVSGEVAELSVADTGEGIPAEIRARIFEPFFSTKADGNGLGLSTVKAGVVSLGGRIEVTSEVGGGSRFSLFLPILEVGAAHSEPPRRSRILVAEDSPVLRRFVGKELEHRGWEVTTTGSVDEVRAELARARPEAALIDWHLGEESAESLLGELRAAGVRVVVMTGDRKEVGVVDLPTIEKPIDWPLLDQYLQGDE